MPPVTALGAISGTSMDGIDVALVTTDGDRQVTPGPGRTYPYEPALRAALQAAATRQGIDLPEGVYCWYSGPSFETPAEIRMLKLLGGDAVGMSTVPEVILARFLVLKVAAISTITNMAAGMSDENISHEHTKAMAPLGAAKLEKILRAYLRGLG